MDTWVCCIGNVGEVCLRKGWGENLQGKLRSIKLPINHERLLLNVINRAAHKMLEFLIKHKVWFFINKKHLKRRRQRHTHRSSATHLSLSLSLSLASGWRKQNNYAPTHPHRYRNTDTQETQQYTALKKHMCMHIFIHVWNSGVLTSSSIISLSLSVCLSVCLSFPQQILPSLALGSDIA